MIQENQKKQVFKSIRRQDACELRCLPFSNQRGQGTFEYILLLGGVLLIVVLALVVLQSSFFQASSGISDVELKKCKLSAQQTPACFNAGAFDGSRTFNMLGYQANPLRCDCTDYNPNAFTISIGQSGLNSLEFASSNGGFSSLYFDDVAASSSADSAGSAKPKTPYVVAVILPPGEYLFYFLPKGEEHKQVVQPYAISKTGDSVTYTFYLPGSGDLTVTPANKKTEQQTTPKNIEYAKGTATQLPAAEVLKTEASSKTVKTLDSTTSFTILSNADGTILAVYTYTTPSDYAGELSLTVPVPPELLLNTLPVSTGIAADLDNPGSTLITFSHVDLKAGEPFQVIIKFKTGAYDAQKVSNEVDKNLAATTGVFVHKKNPINCPIIAGVTLPFGCQPKNTPTPTTTPTPTITTSPSASASPTTTITPSATPNPNAEYLEEKQPCGVLPGSKQCNPAKGLECQPTGNGLAALFTSPYQCKPKDKTTPTSTPTQRPSPSPSVSPSPSASPTASPSPSSSPSPSASPLPSCESIGSVCQQPVSTPTCQPGQLNCPKENPCLQGEKVEATCSVTGAICCKQGDNPDGLDLGELETRITLPWDFFDIHEPTPTPTLSPTPEPKIARETKPPIPQPADIYEKCGTGVVEGHIVTCQAGLQCIAVDPELTNSGGICQTEENSKAFTARHSKVSFDSSNPILKFDTSPTVPPIALKTDELASSAGGKGFIIPPSQLAHSSFIRDSGGNLFLAFQQPNINPDVPLQIKQEFDVNHLAVSKDNGKTWKYLGAQKVLPKANSYGGVDGIIPNSVCKLACVKTAIRTSGAGTDRPYDSACYDLLGENCGGTRCNYPKRWECRKDSAGSGTVCGWITDYVCASRKSEKNPTGVEYWCIKKDKLCSLEVCSEKEKTAQTVHFNLQNTGFQGLAPAPGGGAYLYYSVFSTEIDATSDSDATYLKKIVQKNSTQLRALIADANGIRDDKLVSDKLVDPFEKSMRFEGSFNGKQYFSENEQLYFSENWGEKLEPFGSIKGALQTDGLRLRPSFLIPVPGKRILAISAPNGDIGNYVSLKTQLLLSNPDGTFIDLFSSLNRPYASSSVLIKDVRVDPAGNVHFLFSDPLPYVKRFGPQPLKYLLVPARFFSSNKHGSVYLFTKPNCPACDQVKSWLDKAGVSYQLNPEKTATLGDKLGTLQGSGTYPLTLIHFSLSDYTIVQGSDSVRLSTSLGIVLDPVVISTDSNYSRLFIKSDGLPVVYNMVNAADGLAMEQVEYQNANWVQTSKLTGVVRKKRAKAVSYDLKDRAASADYGRDIYFKNPHLAASNALKTAFAGCDSGYPGPQGGILTLRFGTPGTSNPPLSFLDPNWFTKSSVENLFFPDQQTLPETRELAFVSFKEEAVQSGSSLDAGYADSKAVLNKYDVYSFSEKQPLEPEPTAGSVLSELVPLQKLSLPVPLTPDDVPVLSVSSDYSDLLSVKAARDEKEGAYSAELTIDARKLFKGGKLDLNSKSVSGKITAEIGSQSVEMPFSVGVRHVAPETMAYVTPDHLTFYTYAGKSVSKQVFLVNNFNRRLTFACAGLFSQPVPANTIVPVNLQPPQHTTKCQLTLDGSPIRQIITLENVLELQSTDLQTQDALALSASVHDRPVRLQDCSNGYCNCEQAHAALNHFSHSVALDVSRINAGEDSESIEALYPNGFVKSFVLRTGTFDDSNDPLAACPTVLGGYSVNLQPGRVYQVSLRVSQADGWIDFNARAPELTELLPPFSIATDLGVVSNRDAFILLNEVN